MFHDAPHDSELFIGGASKNDTEEVWYVCMGIKIGGGEEERGYIERIFAKYTYIFDRKVFIAFLSLEGRGLIFMQSLSDFLTVNFR